MMMLHLRVSLTLVVIELLVPHNLVHGEQAQIMNGVAYRAPAYNLHCAMDAPCKFGNVDFSDNPFLDDFENPIGDNNNLDRMHSDRPLQETVILCDRIIKSRDGTTHQCYDGSEFEFHATASNSTHQNKQREDIGGRICLNDGKCKMVKIEKKDRTTFKYRLFALDKWISNKLALRVTEGYSSLLRVTDG